MNVLVVDDQPAQLLAYKAALDETGEDVFYARSGRDALGHLLEHEVAVIILDVNMPDLDGFELAETIRQHPRHQHTPIVFVSATRDADEDRLRGYATGAVDYVVSPIPAEVLRAKVRVFAELYRKTHALAELNRDLDARIAERTAALREADRRKDEFMAMLSHELRTPVASLDHASELLQAECPEGGRMATLTSVIRRQAVHLTRLVGDLFEASRITLGAITLRTETLEITPVISAAVENCTTRAERNALTLTMEIRDEEMRVEGDAVRLVQVVTNLLDNAVKYTPPGGTVEVDACRDGDRVLIRVRDSGVGIEATKLHEIFEPFVRGPTETAHVEGLGIGLALVRHLVELHGGSVAAASRGAGLGSEFVVRLPASHGRLQSKPAITARSTIPLRVVVADDDEDLASMLAWLLQSEGHEVRIAVDGDEALRVVADYRPDVAFLDIAMPGVDGHEVARRIRAEAWGGRITLVAQSGYDNAEDERTARDAGFDVQFTKPMRRADLADILARVSRRS